MVYRKRSVKRYRKTYRRKNLSILDNKYSIRDMAKTAMTGVNYLKGLVNSEAFHFDISSNFSPSNTGSITDLCAIAQGDGPNVRTGNSLLFKSIYINFNIINNNSAASGAIIGSWIIMDTQQVADTAPTFASVFNSNNVLSVLNADTLGRYKVLDHKKIIVDPSKPTVIRKVWVSLRHHVRYNGPNSTDIQKGGLYWIVCSNQTTYTPLVTYVARMTYHDN